MPHHSVAPGGRSAPAPSVQPRVEWSPRDGQLHFVRQSEVTAYFVGYATAVCGHQIRQHEQGQAPEGAEACFYCLLEAGER